MPIIWIVIFIVIVLVILLSAAFSLMLARNVAEPKPHSPEEIRGRIMEADLLGAFDSLPKEEYEVRSFDGFRLHTVFLPAEQPSDRYVILSHGYTINYYGSVPYALMFRDLGFHCILYDSRGHGSNERSVCTMGVSESKDLVAEIEDCYRRFGRGIRIGLHGESMGAGLQIMALGELRKRPELPSPDFVVNDCGYADLAGVLSGKLRSEMHLPGWLVRPASLACRLRYGYSFTGVRPIDALPDNTVPICFIHGDSDSFIPYDHSVRMQKATGGYSELHLFAGAEHAGSMRADRQAYRRIVREFLEKK